LKTLQPPSVLPSKYYNNKKNTHEKPSQIALKSCNLCPFSICIDCELSMGNGYKLLKNENEKNKELKNLKNEKNERNSKSMKTLICLNCSSSSPVLCLARFLEGSFMFIYVWI
jgi:hypothetical protein